MLRGRRPDVEREEQGGPGLPRIVLPIQYGIGHPARSWDVLNPKWAAPGKSQSYVSWDVPGDPRASCLAAPGTSPSPKCPGMSREFPGHPAWLVLSVLGCPRRSQEIPLGCTGHKVPVLSVLECPGRSQDIPLGCAGHKVPVLSVLRCPGRSQDILLGCTGHKVPVLSVLGCPGSSQDIPLG